MIKTEKGRGEQSNFIAYNYQPPTSTVSMCHMCTHACIVQVYNDNNIYFQFHCRGFASQTYYLINLCCSPFSEGSRLDRLPVPRSIRHVMHFYKTDHSVS